MTPPQLAAVSCVLASMVWSYLMRTTTRFPAQLLPPAVAAVPGASAWPPKTA